MTRYIRQLAGLGIALMLMLALAPWASAQMTPSVSVSDQPIVKGTVVVEKVVSNGPGWIVIHAQKDGKPGPILGYSPVADGENANVAVEIDATKATSTLYAMLHTDAGQMGTFEFPNGPDVPVKVNDQVVTPPFQVTFGVGVADQPITGGKVTVAKVFSQGPGWIVIHAQKDGKPGPILGYSPVADGENTNVVVEIDATKATPTLYAMLHTDAGQMGTFEFPNGPDVPMKAGDQVITPPFQVTGGLPTMLPTAGGGAPFWPFLLVVVGGLALVSGLGLTLARRTR
ncbi:MAG: hypothetical protein D6759_16225 [Chloroflexi bacterium]|nr:MAG: hypothetical protein D6759_16225 [Chloroflexota bacterium]